MHKKDWNLTRVIQFRRVIWPFSITHLSDSASSWWQHILLTTSPQDRCNTWSRTKKAWIHQDCILFISILFNTLYLQLSVSYITLRWSITTRNPHSTITSATIKWSSLKFSCCHYFFLQKHFYVEHPTTHLDQPYPYEYYNKYKPLCLKANVSPIILLELSS